MDKERCLKDFAKWMSTLYKGGIKLTYTLVNSALNGDGSFLDVLLKKLNIRTKQEFDNFYNNEYIPWMRKYNKFLRKYKGNKLNHQAFKELYKYFEGNCTLDEALDLIKRNSRRYAKRQYTFFNHQLPVKWFNTDYDNFNNTVNEVCSYIDKNINLC